jgi:hypothetical protein
MQLLISHCVYCTCSDQPKTAELLVIFVAIKFVGVGQLGLCKIEKTKLKLKETHQLNVLNRIKKFWI